MNAINKRRYQEEIATAARQHVDEPLTAKQLYGRVYYFHRGIREGDADNISKPVWDALRGVVYSDDAQVIVRLAAKVAHDLAPYRLVSRGPDTQKYDMLFDALAEGPEHLLYVEIGEIHDLTLVLDGPVG